MRTDYRKQEAVTTRHPSGKINVKFVIILVSVLIVLGVGAVVARHVRRKILAERDFAAGNAAYDKQDWSAAAKHFAEYLGRRPEDHEILRKYAVALLSTEPLEQRGIGKAVGAYRELLRVAPDDVEACEKLAELYTYTGQLSELSYIAEQRLKQDPKDIKAPIWQAQALIALREKDKTDKARKILETLRKRLLEDDLGEHPEYIEACRILSGIAMQSESEQARTEAMEWLNRAVEYDANSAEALLHRSVLRRAGPPPVDEAALKASRDDLQRAEAVKTDDPRITLSLGREWMQHGQLERANRLVQSVREVDATTVKKYFISATDWDIAWFMQASELAIARRKIEEMGPHAVRILEAIKGRRKRLAILPGIVRLYLLAGRPGEARKHLDEYLELLKQLQVKGSEDHTAMLLAMVASGEGNSEEVIRQLEPLSVLDKLSPGAMEMLARTYAQTGQQVRAIRTLRQCLKRQPKNANLWVMLAGQHQRRRQWSEAFDAAKQAESLAGDNLDAKLSRIAAGIHAAGEKLTPDKKSLDALSGELAKLQKDHPAEARIGPLQAMIELVGGRPDAAVQKIRQAIEQAVEQAIKDKNSPKSLELELLLVRVLAGHGRTKEAIEAAGAACDRHGKSPQIWAALAGLHQAAGDRDKARTALQRGLKAVAPGDRQNLERGLAVLELLGEDRKSGLKHLLDLADRDTGDINSRSLLLNLPEVVEDTALAERLLEEIRKVRGEGSLLWRQYRARVWLTGDRWRAQQDKVIKALGEWMFQDPRWSFPALTLARLHLRLGKAGEAERVCRQALSLNPAAVETAGFLVTMLGRQKRHAEAAEVLESLTAPLQRVAGLRLRTALAEGDLATPIRELTLRAAADPRDVSARVLLARLVYQRDRDAKRALAYLDEAAKVQPDSTAVAWLQAAILKNENKTKQARDLLDALVKKNSSFGAHQLRAAFLHEIGELQAAEKDYIHLTTLESRRDGYQLLAFFYQRTNRIDDAVRTLTKGIEGDGRNAGMRFRLIHLLIGRRGKGDLMQAETLLSPLEKQLGETPDVLYARASLVMAQRPKDFLRKARTSLQRLVELEPAQVRGYLALIGIALTDRDPAQAKAIAVRGLEASPNHTQLLLAQGRAEIDLKDKDAAADLARKIIRTNPSNTDAIAMLASLAIESKKPEALSEALALTRKAAAGRTGDYRLPMTAAAILTAMGKPDDAVSEMQRYAETQAGRRSIPVLIALAGNSRKSEKTDDWNRWIRQAEVVSPQHPAVLIERLRGLEAQDKYDEVLTRMAAYRQGKQVDPSVLRAGAVILLSSPSKPCRQEAIKLYERVLVIYPESAVVRLNLALAADRAGDLDRAEKLYREILETQPLNAPALNGLAWMLATNRKDYKAALPLIDKAVKIAPNSSHVRDTRGVILSNLGRLPDARKGFEKCVELTAPDSARRTKALLQLGRTCGKLNDHPAARKHLTEALRLDARNKALTPEQRTEIAEILKGLPA